MIVANISSCQTRHNPGLTSMILLQRSDVGEGLALTVTWVEVAPGGQQQEHAHEPQQVYVIVQGKGIMRVGNEEREVDTGTLIYIPSWHPHRLINVGNESLVYVSASHPSFDVTTFYDEGPLKLKEQVEGPLENE